MIYLDNSATTRTFGSAAEVAKKYMTETYFNPSSAYGPAVTVEKAVNGARRRIADTINVTPNEIIFTSGATESNNMAFSGALRAMRGNGRIIVSAVEHPSVFETARRYADVGYEVEFVGVDATGRVNVDMLKSMLGDDVRFVSIMQVNNETGAVNDIPAVYNAIISQAPGALLHVDGVQDGRQ